MKRVRLVAWREDEGHARAQELHRHGVQAVFEPADPSRIARTLAEAPPDALVIDLSRKPAQGRDLGVFLRVRAGTRQIPLVFAGGSVEARANVRKVLPDAETTLWEEIQGALARVLTAPAENPVVPPSAMAGYSGTPLPKKLGIKAGGRVLLVGAPDGFSKTLGPLPEGVALAKRYSPSVGLILWFVRSRRELRRGLERWVARVGREGIWIVWPKQSSGVPTDLKQNVVRQAGLEAGLVDYKIAAIDGTWSGLKFAMRR